MNGTISNYKKIVHNKRNHQQKKKATNQYAQVLANNSLDKWLTSKIYRKFIQLNTKQTTQVKKK